jgi:hypothetical protein
MNAFEAISGDLGSKIGGYAMSLQSRYGDPRVYAMQREQMQKDRAAVVYSQSKKTEELLSHAYARQAERIRETHTARLSSRIQKSEQTPGHRKRSAAAPGSAKAK